MCMCCVCVCACAHLSGCALAFSPLNAQRAKVRAHGRETPGVLYPHEYGRAWFFLFLYAYRMHVNAGASNIHQLDIRLPVTRVARRTIGAWILSRSFARSLGTRPPGEFLYLSLSLAALTPTPTLPDGRRETE